MSPAIVTYGSGRLLGLTAGFKDGRWRPWAVAAA